jgi:hypothetical protein
VSSSGATSPFGITIGDDRRQSYGSEVTSMQPWHPNRPPMIESDRLRRFELPLAQVWPVKGAVAMLAAGSVLADGLARRAHEQYDGRVQ